MSDELPACPICDVPMHEGRVELHVDSLGRVLGSTTNDVQLRFLAGEAEAGALELDLSRVAYGCESCGGVFLGAKSDAFACFECGTQIPADADACPSCGWVW